MRSGRMSTRRSRVTRATRSRNLSTRVSEHDNRNLPTDSHSRNSDMHWLQFFVLVLKVYHKETIGQKSGNMASLDEKIFNDDEVELLELAKRMLTKTLSDAKVCRSHGIGHAIRVMTHAARALRLDSRVPRSERIAVMLAALLHDADDRKFFKTWSSLDNARQILRATFPALEDRVCTMIDLVSASKNGNSVPPEAVDRPWILWPRFCDRLEACGWIGVERCWEYTMTKGLPLFTAETPRGSTVEAIRAIATPERISEYKGNSVSMIDHYFDKLLGMSFVSGSSYLDGQCRSRLPRMMAVCMVFGEMGGITEAVLEYAKSQVDAEFG